MCGRTCMTLSPNEVCRACSTTERKVQWRNEFNLGKKYEGHVENKGFNVAPQDILPVLVSSSHFNPDEKPSTIVVPMVWGLIPRWHKSSDWRKHGLSTNNCRLEGLESSKLYSPLLKTGKRCVVLCEGFYEWQTVTGAKSSDRKVYYIFVPQPEGVKIEDKKTWANKDVKLLKMAGLFDVWTSETGDKMFSFTVITFESKAALSWLHDRTPAILETEEQVRDWLDFGSVNGEESLKVLVDPKDLRWHQVSNFVNKSSNKSSECNKPFEKAPVSKLMQMWLKKEDKKRPLEEDGEGDGPSPSKKK